MRRRQFIQSVIAGTTLPFGASLNAAERLPRTGTDAEGPYYPLEPIVRDHRLRIDGEHAGNALDMEGRVLDPTGGPIEGIRIEIWQCDARSIYHHPRAPDVEQADPGFRGSGATFTNPRGEFRFETIVPVPYPGRPPHVHAKLWLDKRELLTTQVYLVGQAGASSRKMRIEARADDLFETRFDFVVSV